MTLRDIFTPRAAAAVLALGLTGAPAALAQEMDPAAVSGTVAAQAETDTSASFFSSIDYNADPLVWGALALAGGLIVLGAARQRERGMMISGGLVMAGFAYLLADPEIVTRNHETLPARVVVIADQSDSNVLGDRAAQTETAAGALVAYLESLDNVDVEKIAFNSDMLDGAEGTALCTAVDAAIADIAPERLGAVFMVTDGQVHGCNDATRAFNTGAPLHVYLAGQPAEQDRHIVLHQQPSYGVVDETVPFSFEVTDYGVLRPDRVSVTITRDGELVQELDVQPGEIVEDVQIEIPHAGSNLIAFSVAPLDGEVTLANNTIVADVNGIAEQRKVLVLSGEPHNGMNTWRNLLDGNPAIDYVHIANLSSPEKDREAPAGEHTLIPPPVDELFNRRLGEFDLLIIDQYQLRGIIPPRYVAQIERYAEEMGGAVLVVNGPEALSNRSIYNVLKDILPSAPRLAAPVEQEFTPSVSETGAAHPVTSDLADGAVDNEAAEAGAEDDMTPWGPWYRQIPMQPDAEAHVVMEGAEGAPLLVLGRVGEEGRVAELHSDQLWLWERGHKGGGPYIELVRNVMGWLLRDPAFEEEALALAYDADDGLLTVTRQSLEGDDRPVTIETPQGETMQVALEPADDAPGLWRAVIPAEEYGVYKARQGDLETVTGTGATNPAEFADTRSTPDVLAPFVEQTGGTLTRLANQTAFPEIRLQEGGSAMSGEDWIGVRESDSTISTGSDRSPLLPPWLTLPIFAVLLTGFLNYAGNRPINRLFSGKKPAPMPEPGAAP